MSEIRVHEVYTSIQGESSELGRPCVFIRLAGCPLRCDYCDTEHALSFDSGELMTINCLLEQVAALSPDMVLLTGGEPLAQRNTPELLQGLCAIKRKVQLETSGAFSIRDVPEQVSRIIDVKTPGSGEERRNLWSNISFLNERDEIKFVLTSRDDYVWAKDVLRQRLVNVSAQVLFSPCWGKVSPADLAAWILADDLPVRMQLQLHKVIWGADRTGV